MAGLGAGMAGLGAGMAGDAFQPHLEIDLWGMVRPLVSRVFSSSTLMAGLALTKVEPGLDLPDDDDALAQELEQLQE